MQAYYSRKKLSAPKFDQIRSIKTKVGNVIASDLHQGSKLLLFGSALSGFAAENCDADLCLWFSGECAVSGNRKDQARSIRILTRIYSHLVGQGPASTLNGLEMIPPTAKVPILKCRHKRSGTDVDINVDMAYAVVSTYLQRMYTNFSNCVPVVVLTVKQWAKKKDICDPRKNKTMNSVSWALMVINYMQQEGYVPVFKPKRAWNELPIDRLEERMIQDNMAADDVFTSSWPNGKRTGSCEEILKDFFNHYAEFDFSSKTISVLAGRAKGRGPGQQGSVFIEEPVTGGNTAPSVEPSSLRRIQQELRTARNILNRSGNWEDIFGRGQSYLNGSSPHDMIQITIQHGSNRRPLQVSSGDTVRSLKQQVQSLVGVHPDQQQLLVGSTTALQDDSRTLGSYNVRNGSVITVVARLRGGGGGLVY